MIIWRTAPLLGTMLIKASRQSYATWTPLTWNPALSMATPTMPPRSISFCNPLPPHISFLLLLWLCLHAVAKSWFFFSYLGFSVSEGYQELACDTASGVSEPWDSVWWHRNFALVRLRKHFHSGRQAQRRHSGCSLSHLLHSHPHPSHQIRLHCVESHRQRRRWELIPLIRCQ